MITINGKSFSEKMFKDEIEKEMVRGLAEDIKKQILSVVTPEEEAQLTIEIVGEDLEHLSVNIDGPDEIVEKVKVVFGDD